MPLVGENQLAERRLLSRRGVLILVAAFAITLSLIPFSSPIAMPVRWAAGNLPVSELALSLAILLAAIGGVTWVAARIYRVGILMTGKRPNLKDLVRWIRTA